MIPKGGTELPGYLGIESRGSTRIFECGDHGLYMYYMDRELYKMQSGIIGGVSNHISRAHITRENLVTLGDILTVVNYAGLVPL